VTSPEADWLDPALQADGGVALRSLSRPQLNASIVSQK
jgi:hypothetical protein